MREEIGKLFKAAAAVANGLLNHNNDGRQPVDDTLGLFFSFVLNLILGRRRLLLLLLPPLEEEEEEAPGKQQS